MTDNKLLSKLSQNLLEILNDEEYYDITIEVDNRVFFRKKNPNSSEIYTSEGKKLRH